MPSTKRKFDPSEISPSSIDDLITTWLRLASDYGHVEFSGWQGIEGSNTITEGIASIDGFLQAYAANPPRLFLSGQAPHKSVELKIDYLRGRVVEVTVRLPNTTLISEVFGALDAVSPHGSDESFKASEAYVADVEPSNLRARTPHQPSVSDRAGASNRTSQDSPIVRLNWARITAEEFERVLFNIVAGAEGYINAQWLMNTNAPDRGRDISVERVTSDALSGVRTQRVIIQAKHWLTKSIRPFDVSEALAGMPLWEPPRVHALVIATTGRFTADAVGWIERHNDGGKQPIVEMWAESHVELLLRRRSDLIAQFDLR